MNNRGFTLIELVATIALLAVISIISFVSINGVLEQNKVKNCEVLVNNIKSATKEYVSDNRYNSDFVDRVENYKVTITGDIIEKYLSNTITNPFDKNDVIELKTIEILINLNDDYTAGDVVIINGNSSVIDCDDKKW